MGSLRHPKTQSERRKIAEALDQGVRVRAKRGKGQLPDAYDDLIVAAQSEKVPKKVLDHHEWFLYW